jgi:hypothetical protein
MRMLQLVLPLAAPAIMLPGCQTLPDGDGQSDFAYIFFVDDAGSGKNWETEIGESFTRAGFQGRGEVFRWQPGTDAGSIKYRRAKAEELAGKITSLRNAYPRSQINVVGVAAGSSVAVYALEALSGTCDIDNVLLLSSTLIENYNLSQALSRVADRFVVFTSERDGVLKFLLPKAGEAVRTSDGRPAVGGTRGFRAPPNPTRNTAALYRKLVEIQWPPTPPAGDVAAATDDDLLDTNPEESNGSARIRNRRDATRHWSRIPPLDAGEISPPVPG